MKKFYSFYICALMFFFQIVFSNADAQYEGKETIIYSNMVNVGPLNPHLYVPNEMFAQEMVYEALVRIDEGGQIQPMLATSWRISEDGLTYLFQLRDNVKFSDGTVFNASAVVKNFQAIMNNKNRHEWLPIVEKIASFRAIDELTFELKLSAPYYPALEDLSLPRPFRFISPAGFGTNGETKDGIQTPIGTGPWKLIETRLGEYDLFERNDHYWGKAPHVKYVLLKVIPDPVARTIALNTGVIDLIYGIGQVPYNSFHSWAKNSNFATSLSHPMGGMALAINTNQFPTNELPVRLALQYAVNKKPIIERVFLSSQTQADTLFSPSVPYCNIGLKAYVFDQNKAREILDAAGWLLPEGKSVREKEGKPLEIVFYYIGNDAAQKSIAEILQAQAAEVGIHVIIAGEEIDSFYQRQKAGTFGMITNLTWGPPFEPHAMLGSMRNPSHADYQAQLGLPMKSEIDRKITRVLQTQDVQERQALYTEILTTLHDEAVYLPIFYNSMLLSYKAGVLDGVHFGASQTHIPFEDFSKN